MASTGQQKRIQALKKQLQNDVDPVASRELYLWAVNDGNLYRQIRHPIEINLQKKIAKGKYDHRLALLSYVNMMNEASKSYEKGTFSFLNRKIPNWATPNVRIHAARRALDDFEAEYRR